MRRPVHDVQATLTGIDRSESYGQKDPVSNELAPQCCRGVIGDQAAFIKNENAVRDGAYLAQPVAAKEDGLLAPKFFDQGAHIVHLIGVETGWVRRGLKPQDCG